MDKRRSMLAGLIVIGLLAGCSYGRSFSCKGYPEGVRCQDVATTYLQRHQPAAATKAAGSESETEAESSARPPQGSGAAPIVTTPDQRVSQPLLSAPQAARIWIAPWLDEKNRLHDAAWLYVLLEEPQWVGAPRQRGDATPPRSARVLVPTLSPMVERPLPARPTGREPHSVLVPGASSHHQPGPNRPAAPTPQPTWPPQLRSVVPQLPPMPTPQAPIPAPIPPTAPPDNEGLGDGLGDLDGGVPGLTGY
jgi:type IV conjugative transfer system lipoprotein TraV